MTPKIETFCVKEGKANNSTLPHQLPIYATSSFEMESVDEAINIFTSQKSGHVYSRYGNPTIDTVADKVAAMEGFGSEAPVFGLLTSSGMSAISTVIYACLKSGDAILTQGNLYGGTTELFSKICSRHGIETYFMDFSDVHAVRQKLISTPNIKLVYLETPANPTLACVDLQALATVTQEFKTITVIDNTFCTPYIQRPLIYGIDIVIHSTTKYLNGHGNSIAGAIISQRMDLKKTIWETLKLMGGTCNSFDAWMLNNGLKTLAIRIEKHSSNALFLAKALTNLKGIGKVNYNGLVDNPYHEIATKQMSLYGGMISFEVEGDISSTKAFMDKLKLATHAPTLGDVDTLVLHPATSSHLNVDRALRAANGITDNLVRMSVGIEHPEDILNDIKQAIY